MKFWGVAPNILISDKGVSGLVISTKGLTQLKSGEKEKGLYIESEAGVLKSDVMRIFYERKLSPALFLSGLPGDIGGGVVMNAGVSHEEAPKEFSEIVSWVEVMTLKGLLRYDQSQIEWSYRKTKGWRPGVICRVGLFWPLEEDPKIHIKMKECLKKRRQSQPLHLKSCGSVFKNPYPKLAGMLIEKCRLKGLSKGGAEISKKHGNFIVNTGDATAKDIHYLITYIQKEVKEQFKVDLETEVCYLGRWDSSSDFRK